MAISLAGFAIILILSFIGIPLAFATLAVGFVGFWIVRGDLFGALILSGQEIFDFSTLFGLSVVPLFILMGTLIQRANISDELFEAGYAWVGRYKGGLAMATVLSCAGFSAVSGSSLATAATMSRVAMPPMRKYKYRDSLAAGTLAAGGTLGILIPPSVPMIIYGIVTETNIGAMFIAGILPGILLTSAFLAAIYLRVSITPELGPRGERVGWAEKRRTLYKTWPIIVLFGIVLGGIYLSVFTPTEAGAVGCVGAFVFALSRGRMWSIYEIVEVSADAVIVTARIFIIGGAALIFGQFLNFAGLSGALVEFATSFNLGPFGLPLLICFICIIMGMIFESIGILLLVVPVFLPALEAVAPASGMNPDLYMIWFGIIVIIVVELGLITPPIGINVFTVKSVIPDVDLTAIFAGVVPFVIADLVVLALVFLIPGIAIFLPSIAPAFN
ncbi:MAG: TRAP transporter large permease [Proteobacteria bacterium]|nr:TRAP transporter large permease [Pseudomonadota bacterium]